MESNKRTRLSTKKKEMGALLMTVPIATFDLILFNCIMRINMYIVITEDPIITVFL